MKPGEPKVHRNDGDGFQVEWRGVLLTLRPNPHHGIMGNVTVQRDGKLVSLPFHGYGTGVAFPITVHEEEQR